MLPPSPLFSHPLYLVQHVINQPAFARLGAREAQGPAVAVALSAGGLVRGGGARGSNHQIQRQIGDVAQALAFDHGFHEFKGFPILFAQDRD